MISWVFYDINIDYQHNGATFDWINAFSFLGQIWIYQFIFTLCLISICVGIYFGVFGLYLIINEIAVDLARHLIENRFLYGCQKIIIFILMLLGCIFITFISPVIMEIINYIPPAFVLWYFIDEEIPS